MTEKKTPTSTSTPIPQKCSNMGCSKDAIYKGTSTKESIARIKDREIKNNKSLFQEGTWYYCQQHRDIIGAYCPHLKFEAL